MSAPLVFIYYAHGWRPALTAPTVLSAPAAGACSDTSNTPASQTAGALRVERYLADSFPSKVGQWAGFAPLN